MSSTCHLYIYGDIVGQQVPSRGHAGAVSLTSIKDAYHSNSTCDEVVVHIHSNGGSVYEGFAIYDFLVNTGKQITTIVEGLCCSIATVIFMAGTERKLTENSRFLIHNPWANAEGDAACFMDIAAELQDEQQRLLKFYRQRTGADSRLLQTYMNQEKLMSPELAVELKFATGIIDTVKAMALYRNALHNPYTHQKTKNTLHKTTHNMDKTKKNRFNQLIAGLKNLVKDFKDDAAPAAANKTLAGDDGDLYFDGELTEGTAVYTDPAMTIPAPDGDYEFDDGTTITVDDGLVTDILQASETTTINNDPSGKATLAALRKKLTALKAEKRELENALAESETVMAGASKALQLARSTYRPEKRETRFNKATAPKAETDFADKLQARRAELKSRKSGSPKVG